MSIEDQIGARWQELIDRKVLVPDGVDEDGDIVYVIDAEMLKTVDPKLYQSYMDDMDEALLSLVGKGLLDMSVDDTGEFVFAPTERGVDWIRAFEE